MKKVKSISCCLSKKTTNELDLLGDQLKENKSKIITRAIGLLYYLEIKNVSPTLLESVTVCSDEKSS